MRCTVATRCSRGRRDGCSRTCECGASGRSKYDTVVIVKENYDAYVNLSRDDRELNQGGAGARAAEKRWAGEERWFGDALHEVLAARARRYRGDGRDDAGGGVPDGAVPTFSPPELMQEESEETLQNLPLDPRKKATGADSQSEASARQATDASPPKPDSGSRANRARLSRSVRRPVAGVC